MNTNVLNYLLFNGFKETFTDLYKNSDSQMAYGTLLNKRNDDSVEKNERGKSEIFDRRFRSNSMQEDIGIRRGRSGSGTQLTSSRMTRQRKGSFRNVDLQKQDQNSKISKMLTFKKGI
jgi:hypothetical protein